MFASLTRRMFPGIAALALAPQLCSAGEPEKISKWQLKHDVECRERELARAQCALAEARARLAQADGDRKLAAAEIRKVIAYHQAEIDWIRDNGNRFCEPHVLLAGEQFALAKANAWLAEVEGETAALVTELKKVVGFEKQQLETTERLINLGVASPEDGQAARASLETARRRLVAAEKQLKERAAPKNKDAKSSS